MPEILMPALGADMEDGVILEWMIRPGDAVAHGDVVASVETDKGAIEIEAYAEGVVEELIAPEGARVAVGRPIARLAATAGETDVPAPAAQADVPAPGPATPPAAPAAAPAGPAGSAAPPPVRASPGARRAAAERGVALEGLTGTGPGGTVTRADVERTSAAAPPPAAPAPDRAEALRRATGVLMARSAREIPHYYLEHRIDAGPLTDWIARANEGRPVADRLVLTPFLVRAVALAVRDFPELNGHWVDGRHVPSDAVHVGLAISMRTGGVVAPAVRDADRVPAEELMVRVRDLVERVRAGVMRSSEVGAATVTLSSLGDRSVEVVHGVIHSPQVALIGAGSVLTRPWVVDGRVEARPVLALSLAGDHRVSDGRRGGRFLLRVERLLADPGAL